MENQTKLNDFEKFIKDRSFELKIGDTYRGINGCIGKIVDIVKGSNNVDYVTIDFGKIKSQTNVKHFLKQVSLGCFVKVVDNAE